MHCVFTKWSSCIRIRTIQQRGLLWVHGWQCPVSRCTQSPWLYGDKYWQHPLSPGWNHCEWIIWTRFGAILLGFAHGQVGGLWGLQKIHTISHFFTLYCTNSITQPTAAGPIRKVTPINRSVNHTFLHLLITLDLVVYYSFSRARAAPDCSHLDTPT